MVRFHFTTVCLNNTKSSVDTESTLLSVSSALASVVYNAQANSDQLQIEHKVKAIAVTKINLTFEVRNKKRNSARAFSTSHLPNAML